MQFDLGGARMCKMWFTLWPPKFGSKYEGRYEGQKVKMFSKIDALPMHAYSNSQWVNRDVSKGRIDIGFCQERPFAKFC